MALFFFPFPFPFHANNYCFHPVEDTNQSPVYSVALDQTTAMLGATCTCESLISSDRGVKGIAGIIMARCQGGEEQPSASGVAH